MSAVLLALGVLVTFSPATADISDSLFFLSNTKNEKNVVKPGAYTVLHYFRESCSCCQEKAAELREREKPDLRYSVIFSEQGRLPRYEVYDKKGELLHSDGAAWDWVQKNF